MVMRMNLCESAMDMIFTVWWKGALWCWVELLFLVNSDWMGILTLTA